MSRRIRLQPLTRARVATLGETGAVWVAALPQILAELEEEWSITVGRALPGGSNSYVARAVNAAGEPSVIKVAVPGDDLAEQAATLERAQGRGYVRLLSFSPSRNAIRLESLGRSLQQSALAPEDQVRRCAEVLRIAWQDAAGRRPAVGDDKASGLHRIISELWPALGHPCSERVVEQALTFAVRRMSVDPAELVFVHGDPHPGNLLAVPTPRAGAESGYCFVDPNGFIADRAYDLGVVLRDWNSVLKSGTARAKLERYCGVVADHSGVDATRIWEWAFIERVSSGLYVMAIGSPAVGRPFLESAELLVDA